MKSHLYQNGVFLGSPIRGHGNQVQSRQGKKRHPEDIGIRFPSWKVAIDKSKTLELSLA
jgi:hypothetical protein